MDITDSGKAKLKVYEVLREACLLYKKKFRVLFNLSLFIFLVNLPSNAITLSAYFNSSVNKVLQPFSFLLGLISFAITTLFSVAIYVCISEGYKGRDIGIKQAISMARGIFWRYVGVSLLYFLLIMIPISIMTTIFLVTSIIFINFITTSDIYSYYILIFSILALPLVYLITTFFFAPIIVVTEEKKMKYFSTSRRLVKGDFWKISLLTLGLLIVSTMPYLIYVFILNDYKALSIPSKFVTSLINQLLHIFITPFLSSVTVVLYFKLKKIKGIVVSEEDEFGKNIVVVAGIISFEDEILCMQRGAGKHDYLSYKYEFPGGKVEPEEFFVDALKRELMEEMGIQVAVEDEDFLMTVVHTYPDFEIEMHSYICKVRSKDFDMKEHVDYKWMKAADLHLLDWAAADIPVVNRIVNDFLIMG